MGRLRVQLAVSADWYIAPVDRSYTWLDPYPAEEFGFMKFFASIRAIVMGRASYDEMRKMGPSPFDGLPWLVLTSRPLEGAGRAVTLDELPAAIAAVEGDVWLFGGGQTIAACLERKLVDTLELVVVPRLLGDGVPLFAKRKAALDELELVEARAMKMDVLWLEYRVKR